MVLVVDSSVWIEFFSGSEKARIIEDKDLATSIVAIAEIADKFEREEKDCTNVIQFINEHARVLPLTVEIALKAGKIKNNIRKKKSKFGLFDALHLATAQSIGAQLITADFDFVGIENVMVI